ncbi:hypothetical protein GGTG_13464 [Gaeumannomyces tritici R3-111a-1]|uniref:Uncharacterized protein n=1 Tax=Gaeumannomyces tritici (strain R3-111a-1) TaxID=644352 RepID=J3PIY4_GAET3|nr:hypothetical protein GGTG_13464 [Gaeumannomyces tritici R3-111a-1]EJT68958.1 hypothetical protein GGTG_13464 [Gaeumannomyces tritici R3-111a-1]
MTIKTRTTADSRPTARGSRRPPTTRPSSPRARRQTRACQRSRGTAASSSPSPPKGKATGSADAAGFAEPIPSDPCITAGDLSTYLKTYRWKKEVTVYPNPVSFPSAKDKANWQGALPDIGERHTFQQWWAARRKGEGEPLLALFSVYPKSRRLTKSKMTYMVIIWDCDPRLYWDPKTGAQRQLQNGDRCSYILQRNLYSIVRGFAKTAELFYSVDTSRSGQDRCLFYALKRLDEWYQLKNQEFQGESDPRSLVARKKESPRSVVLRSHLMNLCQCRANMGWALRDPFLKAKPFKKNIPSYPFKNLVKFMLKLVELA